MCSPSDDPQREIVLGPGEIITEITIPRTSGRYYSSYRKIRARRSWDFALAGVALALQFEGRRVLRSRVVLSGAAPIPWRSKEVEDATTGRSLDRATIARAVAVVMKEAKPLSQNGYKIGLFEAVMKEELERASDKVP